MKPLNLLILAANAALLTACHHVYYAPSTVNIPMLEKKGEGRATALYTSGSESSCKGGELQLAYAPGAHFGLQFNAMSAGLTENTGTIDESGKGRYAEFAGGYFQKFDRLWVAEVYGGFGGGSVRNDYGYGNHSTTGITKFFLQPSLSLRSRNVEVGFATRLSVVNWKVKNTLMKDATSSSAETELTYIRSLPSFFVVEPGLLLRVGGDHFKIQGSLTFSNPRFNAYEGLTETLNGSVGFCFLFHTKK